MANTISRKSVVYDILFEVESGKKSAKEAEKSLKSIEKTAGGVETSMKSLGKAFLGAFAIQEVTRRVTQFATEAVNLARQAEGVKKAFSNLNDPNILNQLRAATRGTVSDLELMKAAVRAQNFKIPLQQLGTYFDFARQRARDTGQSVDYLVNSIIDGIGRKSTLVLDNLGLSAVDIQTEFGKTGDLAEAVGNIIKREMGDAGDATDGAADSIDRYNASITNLQTTIGEGLLPVLGTLAESLNLFLTKPIEALGAVLKSGLNPAALAQYVAGINNIGEAAKSTSTGLTQLADEGVKEFTETVADLQAKIKQLKEEQLGVNIATGEGVQKYRDLETEIGSIEQRIKDLTATNETAQKSFDQLVKSLAEIREAQLFLNTSTEEGRREYERFEEQAVKLTETLNGLLDIKGQIIEAIGQEIEINRQLDLTYKETAKTNEANGYLELKLLEQERVAREQLNSVIGSTGDALTTVAGLAKQGSELQIALAISAILINQAQAIAAAIKGGTEFGATTGPAALVATPAAIATLVGGVLSTFAQVFSVLNQAKAAQSQANAFAEGEIDIHRPGEKRGKDSIPSLLMPGESVIKTTSTSRYKPFLQAIQDGNLEDLIRVNYLEPALAMTAIEQAEKDSSIDYSPQWYRQYRTTLDGISISKQSISELRQINKKLSRKNGGWYV